MTALLYPHPSSPGVSKVMRANRSKDTRPEVQLRSALHRRGLRFRKSYLIRTADLKVRADVAFPSLKLAVFLDGCFWHSCPSHGVNPSVNAPYWRAKLQRNSQRDAHVNGSLAEAGWSVIRVWEHEDSAEASKRLADIVREVRGCSAVRPDLPDLNGAVKCQAPRSVISARSSRVAPAGETIGREAFQQEIAFVPSRNEGYS